MKSIFENNKTAAAMENKPKQKIKLLPSYFKLIGVGLIIAAIAVLFSQIQLPQPGKKLLGLSIKTFFMLGLAFVAWAKDRNEYLELMDIRLRLFISSFLFGVLYIIIVPFANLTQWPIGHISGYGIIVMILTCYLIEYYWEKLKIRRKSKMK